MRNYFRATSPTPGGSSNLAGISDPVADALVEKAVGAQTQATLDNTCRALDRVLRSGRYWISHWNKASHWIAYWDQFGFPRPKRPLRTRCPGHLVVRTGQGRQTRAGEIAMSRLYRPPHSADDPDAARHPVRLLRGRAVRAGRAGRARARAALRRRHRRRLRAYRASPAATSAARPRSARPPMPSVRNIAARRGSIPDFIKKLESAVRLRPAGAGALRADGVEFLRASISARAISATSA